MFDSLLNWFSEARTWLDWLWRECWRQVAKVFTSVWGVGLIVVGWICTGAKWVGDSLQELAGAIDQIKFPSMDHSGGPMTQALEIANTFLPLQEMFSFVVAYIALRCALSMYRHIRSWLPTLS